MACSVFERIFRVIELKRLLPCAGKGAHINELPLTNEQEKCKLATTTMQRYNFEIFHGFMVAARCRLAEWDGSCRPDRHTTMHDYYTSMSTSRHKAS